MTALGLVVAVPAVLAYNWLVRRNKTIMEDLAAFTNDLHGFLMSDGRVKPTFTEPARAGNTTNATTTAGSTAGGRQPLRTGSTQTGAERTTDRV